MLSKQFSKQDLYMMKIRGYTPKASSGQRVGGRVKYELDHNQEIQFGGNVYDMDNIIIRTPLNHIRKTQDIQRITR